MHRFSTSALIAVTALLISACGEDHSALTAQLCANEQGSERTYCECEAEILLDDLNSSQREMVASMVRINMVRINTEEELRGAQVRQALLKEYSADEIDDLGRAMAAPMAKATVECPK